MKRSHIGFPVVIIAFSVTVWLWPAKKFIADLLDPQPGNIWPQLIVLVALIALIIISTNPSDRTSSSP